MSNQIKEYRNFIADAQTDLQRSQDLWVGVLSSVMLVLSIGFLPDIAPPSTFFAALTLVASWLCLSLALISLILSIALGVHAHGTVIRQIDDKSIYESTPGHAWSKWSAFFHAISPIFLVIGLFANTIYAAIFFLVVW